MQCVRPFPYMFHNTISLKTRKCHRNYFVTKRILNTKSIELFKQKLYETSWDEMEMSQNPNQAYKTFLTKFIQYLFSDKNN